VAPGVAQSPPPTLTPAAPQAAAPASANNGNAATADPVAPDASVPTDIGALKPAPTALDQPAAPLSQNSLYQLAWLVPLLLLGADYGWQWQKRRRNRLPERARRSQAQKQARQVLARARKQPDAPSKAACQALLGYLGDKLNEPTVGLTQSMLVECLRERGVSDDLTQRVQQLLTVSESTRFAPVGTQSANGAGSHLLDDTEQLIADLEKALKQ